MEYPWQQVAFAKLNDSGESFTDFVQLLVLVMAAGAKYDEPKGRGGPRVVELVVDSYKRAALQMLRHLDGSVEVVVVTIAPCDHCCSFLNAAAGLLGHGVFAPAAEAEKR